MCWDTLLEGEFSNNNNIWTLSWTYFVTTFNIKYTFKNRLSTHPARLWKNHKTNLPTRQEADPASQSRATQMFQVTTWIRLNIVLLQVWESDCEAHCDALSSMLTSAWCFGAGVTKVKIHAVREHECTKFYGNPSNSCRDISVWIRVVDQTTDWPNDTAIHRATALAWLQM